MKSFMGNENNTGSLRSIDTMKYVRNDYPR